MDNARKMAYRDLLYLAMNDIRSVGNWFEPPDRLSNPETFRVAAESITRAGDIANWLHNVAGFSTFDFDDVEKFDEDRFWREHARVCERFPDVAIYRDWFEQRLKEFGGSSTGGKAAVAPRPDA